MSRFSVVDPAAPPPLPGHTYFAPSENRTYTSPRTGRRLQKPIVTPVPGAEPGVVSFADTHRWGDDGVYIDYMATRRDQREQGHAHALVEHIAQQYPGTINFGRVMHPSVWSMMQGLEARGRTVMGKHDF
jgi:hypothetical protein